MKPAVSAEVRVIGLHRGREIDATLPVQLHRGLLTVGDGSTALTVPLAEIDGWQDAAGRITLYIAGGDVLDLSLATDDARQFARALLEAATAPPELTRSLRSLGDVREGDHAAHDRWFGPLLRARASIEGVSDPLRQCALLQADRIGAEVERAIDELAAVRSGGDPSRTRALVARIEEETEAVRESLARVALAESTLEGSAPDSRLADWRHWIETVRSLFRAIDDAWPEVVKGLRGGME